VKVPDSQRGSLLNKTLEWGRRWTKYLRQKWPQVAPELLENINGEWGRLHWVFRFESIADRDKWTKEVQEDPGQKSLWEELVALEDKHGSIPLLTQITHNFYRIVDLG